MRVTASRIGRSACETGVYKKGFTCETVGRKWWSNSGTSMASHTLFTVRVWYSSLVKRIFGRTWRLLKATRVLRERWHVNADVENGHCTEAKYLTVLSAFRAVLTHLGSLVFTRFEDPVRECRLIGPEEDRALASRVHCSCEGFWTLCCCQWNSSCR